MKPLNYCRELKRFNKMLIKRHSFTKDYTDVLKEYIDLCNRSEKFLLPDGGLLLDTDLKGIDETQKLRLPHQCTCIEYAVSGSHSGSDTSQSTKRILFAEELEDSNIILIKIAYWADNLRAWLVLPEIGIPRDDYLIRDGSGVATIKMMRKITVTPEDDYQGEVSSLLGLINILNCSNVNMRTTKTRRPRKSKARSPYPFDSYQILMVGGQASPYIPKGVAGSGRSPREHVRRGHIRRLQSGHTIWVNASIVNAGASNGLVTKNYRVSHA